MSFLLNHITTPTGALWRCFIALQLSQKGLEKLFKKVHRYFSNLNLTKPKLDLRLIPTINNKGPKHPVTEAGLLSDEDRKPMMAFVSPGM